MDGIADTTPFYKRLAYNLLSLTLLGVVLYVGHDILKPLFFAILLSVLLLPVVHFFRRIKFNRIFSILITLVLSSAAILAVLYFISRQVFNFLDDFDGIQKRLDALYYSLQHWVKDEFGVTIARQDEYIHDTGEKLDTSRIVGRTFVSLTGLLSYFVFLPIYTFLILYYKDLIKKFIIAAFSTNNEDKVREILGESRAVSHRYIVGLLLEMLVVFALNATGFLILGIQYAFFLALVAALLNLVPYIGMLVANIFCMVITFVLSENGYDALWVCAILAVVQLIDNNLLMPLIVGSKVKINALVTLLGVLVGGALFGISGMFLSIPGLAVLKVIFDRVGGLKPYGIMLGDDSIEHRQKSPGDKSSQDLTA
jgi:predicted PurR-regulated permease PerM